MTQFKNLKRAMLAGFAGLLFGGTPAEAGQGAAQFVPVTKNITTNTRWTRDKVYILTRMIFVHNNATLTIEPGTIIRGIKKNVAGSDLANEPGALIAARTGKIIANGTAEFPIIMTSINDTNVPGGVDTVPLSFKNSKGIIKAVSLQNYTPNGPVQNNGFAHCETWGGLVILGRSYLGAGATGSTDGNADGISDTHTLADDGLVTDAANFIGADVIEGINATLVPNASGPGTSKLGVYGGTNDSDNSGVLRFVSIRYAGDVIGSSNELNGITFGAAGSNTVMEHCEVLCNTDDGYEWFGSKMDARFLFSIYNRDDGFDADEGARVRGQFFTVMQGDDTAVRAGYPSGNGAATGHSLNSTGGNFYNQLMEIDGSEPNNSGNLPQTKIDIYNFTFISAGANGGGTEHAVRYRLGATGSINNGYAGLLAGASAMSLSDTDGTYSLDARNVHAHLFTQPGGGGNDKFTNVVNDAAEASSQLNSIAPYTKNGVDLRVSAASAVRTEDGTAPPAAFANVRYAAAALDSTHLNGWSALNALGVLPVNHPTRIEPVLGITGTDNPTVTFQFSGRGGSTVDYPAGTKFLVERSSDQRTWTPVGVVADGGPSDDAVAVGTITLEDSAVLAAGAIYYRVIAL